jgi:hypothetical protein
MPKLILALALAFTLAFVPILPTARAELIFFAGTVTAASGRSDIPQVPPPVVPDVGDPVSGTLNYLRAPDGIYDGFLSFSAGGTGGRAYAYGPLLGNVLFLTLADGGVGGRVSWTPGSPGGGSFDYATDRGGSGLLEIRATIRQVDNPSLVPEPPAWALALVGTTLTVGWAGWATRAGWRIARERR